jgi:hypothetical protein
LPLLHAADHTTPLISEAPVYQPTNFCRPGVQKLLGDLDTLGIEQFKRWPQAAIWFYPLYGKGALRVGGMVIPTKLPPGPLDLAGVSVVPSWRIGDVGLLLDINDPSKPHGASDVLGGSRVGDEPDDGETGWRLLVLPRVAAP